MVVLKKSEDRECIVRLALEAALQPEFQDLQVVCKDGVLGVSSFILGALSSFLVSILGEADLEESVIILPDHNVSELKELLSSLHKKDGFKDNSRETEKIIKTLQIQNVFLRPKEVKDVSARQKPSTKQLVECLNPPIQEFLQNIPEFSDIESAELFDPEYLEDIEIENEENLSLTIHSNDSDFLPPLPAKKKSSSKRKIPKKKKTENNTLSNNNDNPKKQKKKKKVVRSAKDPISEEGELIYSCSLCEERFKTENQLIFHKKSHLNLEQGQQTCKFCGKYFKKMFQMQNHLRIHTGDKPYVCHTCGKAFNQETTLRTHMRIHSGLKPFKCDECGEAFNASNALSAHKMWKHNEGSRPFLCSFCSKSFPTKAAVRKHETIHKAEKKHACTLCEKKFARADHLKSHLRSHKDGCII